MAAIELVHLSKVYGNDFTAVRDLNLDVAEGEFMVLVGPSGCGKTTALRMIAGLEEITAGEIRIEGKVVNDLAPRDRDIAMVFQNYALYPHKNVYDNLAFGLRMRKVPKDEQKQRVEEIARILGLGDMLHRRPAQLSGGQRQRVAMGRAIVREPQLFLMDEPLSNVDVRARAQIRGEIVRIQRTVAVTTVYVTHDQTEALILGDRVAVLRNGRIEQISAPRDLYQRPDNLFVAGFVGSPPMNLAEATIEETDDSYFLRFGGYRIKAAPESPDGKEMLQRYAWRQVVVGIRPEELNGAEGSGIAEGLRMRIKVERRESVGPDVNVYFTMDAPLVITEDPGRDEKAGKGKGKKDAPATPLDGRNEWMARLGPSRVEEGDEIELAIKPGRIHLFDPRSGDLLAL
jgi:multiple sugar transport system ATP-binding protein